MGSVLADAESPRSLTCSGFPRSRGSAPRSLPRAQRRCAWGNLEAGMLPSHRAVLWRLGFFIGVPAEISTVQLSRLLLLVSPGASNFWSLPRQRQPQALSVVCSGRRAPPPVGARLTAPGECPGRLPGLAFHSQERPVSPLATPGSRRETEPRLLSLMH